MIKSHMNAFWQISNWQANCPERYTKWVGYNTHCFTKLIVLLCEQNCQIVKMCYKINNGNVLQNQWSYKVFLGSARQSIVILYFKIIARVLPITNASKYLVLNWQRHHTQRCHSVEHNETMCVRKYSYEIKVGFSPQAVLLIHLWD